MYKTLYRVTVRIGFNDFHKEFENEKAAMDCFNSIAVPSDDVEIEGDRLTLDGNAEVADVTIRRYAVPLDVGNPNRQ